MTTMLATLTSSSMIRRRGGTRPGRATHTSSWFPQAWIATSNGAAVSCAVRLCCSALLLQRDRPSGNLQVSWTLLTERHVIVANHDAQPYLLSVAKSRPSMRECGLRTGHPRSAPDRLWRWVGYDYDYDYGQQGVVRRSLLYGLPAMSRKARRESAQWRGWRRFTAIGR
jgi:hypothetical protein